MSSDLKDDLGLSYEEALHGVQAGVQHEIDTGGTASTPKHLRVGIESAHVSDAALVRLLVDKGIITQDEFAEYLRREANRELIRYEARASTARVKVNFRGRP